MTIRRGSSLLITPRSIEATDRPPAANLASPIPTGVVVTINLSSSFNDFTSMIKPRPPPIPTGGVVTIHLSSSFNHFTSIVKSRLHTTINQTAVLCSFAARRSTGLGTNLAYYFCFQHASHAKCSVNKKSLSSKYPYLCS